jgi:DNA-binding XRE family transcriptional regulator
MSWRRNCRELGIRGLTRQSGEAGESAFQSRSLTVVRKFGNRHLRAYTVPCKLKGMEMGGDTAGGRRGRRRRPRRPTWEASSVRALRRHLGLSQRDMAEEMGVRQQTVSEWETGLYRPRGASARLLAIIAERASFEYGTGNSKLEARKAEQQDDSRS